MKYAKLTFSIQEEEEQIPRQDFSFLLYTNFLGKRCYQILGNTVLKARKDEFGRAQYYTLRYKATKTWTHYVEPWLKMGERAAIENGSGEFRPWITMYSKDILFAKTIVSKEIEYAGEKYILELTENPWGERGFTCLLFELHANSHFKYMKTINDWIKKKKV